MITIRRVALIVALVAFFLPRASLAGGLNFELNVNSSDIELKGSRKFSLYDNYTESGVGLYYCDDYLISNLNFALKDKVLIPGLTLGLGLKALLGEVEIHNRDYDLMAISFLVLGEYEFGERFFNLPVNASAHISMAPDPLCFSDTDRYLEYCLGIHLYVVKNGAIGIIYRGFEARFDDPSGRVKESDDALLLGFKLGF